MISNNKFIICIRHGERIDHLGLTPLLHRFDPELTSTGKAQAIEAGKLIKYQLMNNMRVDFSKKILVMSSPFARTLQTAKGLIYSLRRIECEEDKLDEDIPVKSTVKGELNVDNEIFIENSLCEHIDEAFEREIPQSFLSLITGSEYLKKEISDTKITLLNSFDRLPQRIESSEICFARVKALSKKLISLLSKESEYSGVILVSHASPVDYMNQVFGYPGPYGWSSIQFCSTYYYQVDCVNKTSTYMMRTTPAVVKH